MTSTRAAPGRYATPSASASLGSERDVVVDLTEVTSIDVTATRVLAYASREASLSGNHVTLRGCGPAVRRMLHLSRLMRFVDVERAA